MVSFGQSGFDSQAPENQPTRTIVPAGEYRAIMIESERVATKSGDGHFLKTTWQIVSGEFQNNRLWHNFNLWLNPSKAQAIQIAAGQLSELCRAVGVLTPKDSGELMNKTCIIKVKVRKDDHYGDKSEITGFKSVNGQAAPSTIPSSGSTTTNPWQ